jgi:hypothetical protein
MKSAEDRAKKLIPKPDVSMCKTWTAAEGMQVAWEGTVERVASEFRAHADSALEEAANHIIGLEGLCGDFPWLSPSKAEQLAAAIRALKSGRPPMTETERIVEVVRHLVMTQGYNWEKAATEAIHETARVYQGIIDKEAVEASDRALTADQRGSYAFLRDMVEAQGSRAFPDAFKEGGR